MSHNYTIKYTVKHCRMTTDNRSTNYSTIYIANLNSNYIMYVNRKLIIYNSGIIIY